MTRQEDSSRAHTDDCRMVDELRRMPSRNIGRLLQAPLGRYLDGHPEPGDREALDVGGTVLSERKRRRKAA